VTNEQYLWVSYFAAGAGGLALAVVTPLILRGPLRQAVAELLFPVGWVIRRALPGWLVLLVVLAFLSVSYIDCDHPDYASAVEDRTHLVDATRQQARRMLLAAGVGTLAFVLGLSVALAALPRPRQDQFGQGAGDRPDTAEDHSSPIR